MLNIAKGCCTSAAQLRNLVRKMRALGVYGDDENMYDFVLDPEDYAALEKDTEMVNIYTYSKPFVPQDRVAPPVSLPTAYGARLSKRETKEEKE